MSWWRRSSREATERERSFVVNGGLLQEKLIALNDGRYNPFRSFSIEELRTATNNYDRSRMFRSDGLGNWYKGCIENRVVSVYRRRSGHYGGIDEVVNDIAVAAQVGDHKNVLKLIGCCLESPVPISVYEYLENAKISDQIAISGEKTGHLHVTWKSRLKIAREIAYAVAYLHTAFPRPIVHRYIHPSSIFLDEHNNTKLFDFSLSISIHENETLMTERISGTFGYMSPEYEMHGEVTEKIDVYSFGALLLLFLTGRHPHELINVEIYPDPQIKSFVKHYATCHSMDEIMDHRVLAEGEGINERQQGKTVMELVLKCLETAKEQRPTMVEVTKQLIQIERALTTVGEEDMSGKMFMEEFIASCDPHIRVSLICFSAEEIRKAIDDYNPTHIFGCNKLGIWYKGHMGNLIISVCKICKVNWHEHVKNECRIAIQLSARKHVLKLLGYCLETPVPTLAYESAEALPQYFPTEQSMPLRRSLRIARKIAKEVAYLHTAFPLPLIHGNIAFANVFLDKNGVPKLCNFSQSISIHEGETLTVDPVDATNRYMPPEYLKGGVLTEKVDVYSFGMLLVQILVERGWLHYYYYHDNSIANKNEHEVLDYVMTYRRGEDLGEQKLEALVKLACRCMAIEKDERPTMTEVARELKQLEVVDCC